MRRCVPVGNLPDVDSESSAAATQHGVAQRHQRSAQLFAAETLGHGAPRLDCQQVELLVSCLNIPLLVMDAEGHDRWRNLAAARLIDPDRVAWHRALTAAAAAVLRETRFSHLAMRTVYRVQVRDAKYIVRGCLLSTRDGRAIAALHVHRVCLIHRAPDSLRDRHGLTHQETRVAALMAEGYSDAEIGRLLSVSPHTARSHSERVRRKLHVRSRAQVNRVLLTEWGGDDDA